MISGGCGGGEDEDGYENYKALELTWLLTYYGTTLSSSSAAKIQCSSVPSLQQSKVTADSRLKLARAKAQVDRLVLRL